MLLGGSMCIETIIPVGKRNVTLCILMKYISEIQFSVYTKFHLKRSLNSDSAENLHPHELFNNLMYLSWT
jgi:hypothetical protein